MFTYESKCAPLSSGILSVLLIDQARTLHSWVNSSTGFWGFLKKSTVYGFLGLRLKADYSRFYNLYFFNFVNHFDFNTIGQIFALVTSAFIKGMALIFVAA